MQAAAMPHGYCYLWEPGLIGLHAVSDTLIAVAYFTIPVTLIRFIRRRRDLPFTWMFWCFGAFILACGMTHALGVLNIWVPTWWLSGGVKAVTALASIPTAVLLHRLMPEAVALPSPAQLAAMNTTLTGEVARRTVVEAELREAHTALEDRVAERTAELATMTTALAESERRLRSFLDHLPAVAYLRDTSGRYLLVNAACARLVGRPRAEIEGVPMEAVVSSARAEQSRAHDEAVRAFGEPIESEDTIELPDGLHQFSSVQFPLRDFQGTITAVGGVSFDVTERRGTEARLRRTEEQLLRAQRLEAVGRLAGGVAHDFNNLLTVINNLTMMMLDRQPTDPVLRADLLEVREAGQRAARLTSQLLAFSRRQVVQPETLDLNDVVHQTARLLRRVLGEDVRLVTTLASDLGAVDADRGQLEQVLMNLAVNARDAMPEGGTLTLETANVTLDASFVSERLTVTPGPYVMLAVSDTGVGMDPLVQAQIFEPFFTTKEAGRGTGLGLSMVYGIVQQHGGSLYVYSEPGRGSTFKVYLPRVDAARVTPVPSSTPVPAPTSGAGTILLVEDDPGVRRLTARLLREEGYRVLEADSAEAALTQSGEASAPDLLLTDVVLPGQHGAALAQALRARFPELPVLFVSGYADAAVHQQVAASGFAFLTKPFTQAALVQRVREALDQSVRRRETE